MAARNNFETQLREGLAKMGEELGAATTDPEESAKRRQALLRQAARMTTGQAAMLWAVRGDGARMRAALEGQDAEDLAEIRLAATRLAAMCTDVAAEIYAPDTD